MREIMFVGWVNLVMGVLAVVYALVWKHGAWKSLRFFGGVMVVLGILVLWVVDWPKGI